MYPCMSDMTALPLCSGREQDWLEVTTVIINESTRRQNESLNDYNEQEKILFSFSIKEYGSTPYLRITQVLKWPPVHKA